MKSLIQTGLSVAAKFSRYTDNLLTLNNPDFQAYIGQIYSPELELKKTTENIDSCSYLFNSQLPHMDSNICTLKTSIQSSNFTVQYVVITKILLTDLNYSQPDYLDKATYTKNSVELTRPLCIATPRLYTGTGGG